MTNGTNFSRQPMDPMLSKKLCFFSQSNGNGIEQFDIIIWCNSNPMPIRFFGSMELFPLQTSIMRKNNSFPPYVALIDDLRCKPKQYEHHKWRTMNAWLANFKIIHPRQHERLVTVGSHPVEIKRNYWAPKVKKNETNKLLTWIRSLAHLKKNSFARTDSLIWRHCRMLCWYPQQN